ncbi:MAG: hypothetical protein AUJ98_04390 [Bacteroidetes bacterium CG2_30_33_31]|nr:MAG: hypothetical protein AUJ98_04390 [Bacteroidetes bacterium CG2_30_33_31]
MNQVLARILSITAIFIIVNFVARPVFSQEIVKDSSFEIGHPNTYWVESSTNFSSTICSSSCGNCGGPCQPNTGSHYVWLGGSTIYEEGFVKQTVTIPVLGNAILSFYLKTPKVAANIDDFLKVFVDSTEIFYINSSDSSTYKQKYKLVNIDISSFANGQSHVLKFLGHQTGNPSVTHYLIDDVNIINSVGYNIPDNNQFINIYPNPAHEYINIDNIFIGNSQINIFTLDGKNIFHAEYSNSKKIKIDTRNFEKGIYFISINQKNTLPLNRIFAID